MDDIWESPILHRQLQDFFHQRYVRGTSIWFNKASSVICSVVPWLAKGNHWDLYLNFECLATLSNFSDIWHASLIGSFIKRQTNNVWPPRWQNGPTTPLTSESWQILPLRPGRKVKGLEDEAKLDGTRWSYDWVQLTVPSKLSKGLPFSAFKWRAKRATGEGFFRTS